jgi:hypothetical protein
MLYYNQGGIFGNPKSLGTVQKAGRHLTWTLDDPTRLPWDLQLVPAFSMLAQGGLHAVIEMGGTGLEA